MTTIARLVIGGEQQRWRNVGFEVAADGTVQVGGVQLCLVDGAPGLRQWVLADAPDTAVVDIDGLCTGHGNAPLDSGSPHPNSALSIDHIVVNTPTLERTCDAIAAATGAPLRRVREAGAIRQGFHRLGEVIIEVVTHPAIPPGLASFWGLAINVGDIDGIYELAGRELMSAPKDAVQPGRRIASFREAAGLGLPVAVMTAGR